MWYDDWNQADTDETVAALQMLFQVLRNDLSGNQTLDLEYRISGVSGLPEGWYYFVHIPSHDYGQFVRLGTTAVEAMAEVQALIDHRLRNRKPAERNQRFDLDDLLNGLGRA